MKEGKLKFKQIKAREILDSRGNPTVEVDLITKKGTVRSNVPSGASTGKHEALELRDGGKRYMGKGVSKAIKNVQILAKKIKSKELDLKKIDKYLVSQDTAKKKKFGANAHLAISMAVARACALEKRMPLYKYISSIVNQKIKTNMRMPVPFANVINGGKHAEGALAIQELMIVPTGARSFKEATQMVSETYHILKKIIEHTYGKSSTHVGDEGGFVPNLANTYDALDLIQQAIETAGYNKKIKIAIDAAASEFYNNKKYQIDNEQYFGLGLSDLYEDLVRNYPIISIEDPFAQDDFRNWNILFQRVEKLFENKDEMKTKLNEPIQIVGDDLTVSNPKRIKQIAREHLCNALLLKVNQIGTVSQAIDAAILAKQNKWNVMVSHRSGDTEDTFIADLAVGLGCGQIKLGAPCRGERTAKYNQLIRIEEELGRVKYGWR
ncbi:phosphopyruvate hydratase [Nanoarchaeota archaeon]